MLGSELRCWRGPSVWHWSHGGPGLSEPPATVSPTYGSLSQSGTGPGGRQGREAQPSPCRRQEAGGRRQEALGPPHPPHLVQGSSSVWVGQRLLGSLGNFQPPPTLSPWGPEGPTEMQARPAVTLRPLQHSGPFSAGPCPSPHLMLCGPRAPGSRSQTDVGFPGPPWAFLSPIRP